MRIGIVGNYAQGSYSEGLALAFHRYLGQTVYTYPIEYTNASKPFPLSTFIQKTDLDYIITVQGHLIIDNDIEIPVLYFHRELRMSFIINKFKILAIRHPTMMKQHIVRDFDNKILLLPAVTPNIWSHDKQKDLFISTVSREYYDNYRYFVSVQTYKDLMQRSQHTIINNKYNLNYRFVSVRSLEALACKTIPVLYTDGTEQCYRNMGFNESNCYFNELPTTYDLEKVKAGQELLKKHTILERAKQILEVIKNEMS